MREIQQSPGATTTLKVHCFFFVGRRFCARKGPRASGITAECLLLALGIGVGVLVSCLCGWREGRYGESASRSFATIRVVGVWKGELKEIEQRVPVWH